MGTIEDEDNHCHNYIDFKGCGTENDNSVTYLAIGNGGISYICIQTN